MILKTVLVCITIVMVLLLCGLFPTVAVMLTAFGILGLSLLFKES